MNTFTHDNRFNYNLRFVDIIVVVVAIIIIIIIIRVVSKESKITWDSKQKYTETVACVFYQIPCTSELNIYWILLYNTHNIKN